MVPKQGSVKAQKTTISVENVVCLRRRVMLLGLFKHTYLFESGLGLKNGQSIALSPGIK